MITSQKKDFKKIHTHCMVCGLNNYRSLKMRFATDESGKTYAQFQGNGSFQGYNGILHGGIITTLLDAAMTHCLFDHGIIAFTGDLRVRFLRPVCYDALVDLQAQIIKVKKACYILKSEIIYLQKTMAWAEAKFAEVSFADSF